jgi:hypothetical protein
MNNWERQQTARQILICLIILLTLLLLGRVVVDAQALPEASQTPHEPNLGSEWTPETHTMLAAALVGEAGWKRVPDHDAIPWLLYRRWQAIGGSFHATVQSYCRALDGSRPWLLGLNADGTEPVAWPARDARWSTHRLPWLKIHERLGQWADGKIKDPCQASHFGGKMDRPRGRMVLASCVGTKNRFYRVE